MKKIRLLSVVLCFAVTVCGLSGCSMNIDLTFTDSSSQSSIFMGEPWRNESSYVVTDTMEKYDYSVKNTLSDRETVLYNRLVNLLNEKNTVFDFDNVTNDEFKRAYYAVLYDHPEYLRTGFNYNYSVKTLGDYVKFHAEPALFSDDPDVMTEAEKELEAVVSSVVQRAKAQADPYYTVKYVHDYIIDNTDYDEESLAASRSENDGLIIASTAYGCLVNKKAVCSGYAAAFQLIMQRLGYECGRINGTRMTESGAHQWNYVGIDGEYYFMDVTWDDPIKEDGQGGKTYDYFLINDNDLSYTHTSDRTLPQPVCSSTRYNYFYYNGLYFDVYDFRYVSDAAQRLRENNVLTVKFSDPNELQRAVDDLIIGQRLFELDFIGGSIFYSVSTSGCILNVEY